MAVSKKKSTSKKSPAVKRSTLTREAWLQRAVDLLRPLFKRAHATIPEHVHVSVGFPSNRALSAKKQSIGQCWSPESSSDKRAHIFISPVTKTPADALAVLVHELVHAAVGNKEKHRGQFKRVAVEIGLRGKMTATHAGPELLSELEVISKAIGRYPHAALNPEMRPTPKQTTRLIKATCDNCGYIIRTTGKWIEEVGLPTCACGGSFEIDIVDEKKKRKAGKGIIGGMGGKR